MSKQSYDQIAGVYATDMGQSMAFDDIGYYRQLCQQRGGAVLELGCGTGRILLPLLKSGIDIDGIDQSDGMLAQLQEDAKQQQLAPRAWLGTLTEFTSTRGYRTILLPYSLLTYLTTPTAVALCFSKVKATLEPDGMMLIDTFIPKRMTYFEEFKLDYRRPHGNLTLQREKRITQQGDCNRIERRYTLLHSDGTTERRWNTVDVIRPWTENGIVEMATADGWHLLHTDYDYGKSRAATAQFVTLYFAAR